MATVRALDIASPTQSNTTPNETVQQRGVSDGRTRVQQITVMSMNDSHGYAWADKYGASGMAPAVTIVKHVRREIEGTGKGHVIMLHAGDLNSGNPASDLISAEPMTTSLNHLGVVAMCAGNHEFDKDKSVFGRQRGESAFPWLGANVYRADGTRALEPYTLVKRGDLTIGIMGFVTEDTPNIAGGEVLQGLSFRPVIPEAQTLVRELRDEKHCNIIIALTHLGFDEHGTRTTPATGDYNLASEVSGIDLIVGGHSHTLIKQTTTVNGVPIAQAGCYAQAITRTDLLVETDIARGTSKITHADYRTMPINERRLGTDSLGAPLLGTDGKQIRVPWGVQVTPDPALQRQLDLFSALSAEQMNRKIGDVTGSFIGRGGNYGIESNLGHLIAASQRFVCKTDIAVINNGGIRTSLGTPGETNAFTFSDLFKILPFGNTLSTVTLTPANFLTVLRGLVFQAGTNTNGHTSLNHRRLHLDGITLRIEGIRIVSAQLDDGRMLVENDASIDGPSITLSINSFSVSGKDGWPDMRGYPCVDTGLVDLQTLEAYIETQGGKLNADDPRFNRVRIVTTNDITQLEN